MGFGSFVKKSIKKITKGSLGKALGTVAAIAIPFVAPAVAPILASYGITNLAAASALSGAVLGAANDRLLLGGSGVMGALTGGIGGGIAGYSAANAAVPTASSGVASGTNLTGYGVSGLPDVSGAYGSFGISPETAEVLGVDASTIGGLDSSLSGTLGSTGLSGTLGSTGLGNTLSGTTPLAGLGVSSTMRIPTTLASSATGATSALGSVADGISGVWNGMSDNAQQALIKGAGTLTAGYLSGAYSLPDVYDAQKEYLDQISETQKEAYAKKMAAAEGLIGQARYYDPYYYGTQAQNDALIKGTAAKNDALRSMSGSGRTYASDAEARRYNLGTSLNASSAYTQAADTAQNQKVRTIQAGLNAMPDGVSDISSAYNSLYGNANDLSTLYNKTFRDIFGTLYGKSNDKQKSSDAYNTGNSWLS